MVYLWCILCQGSLLAAHVYRIIQELYYLPFNTVLYIYIHSFIYNLVEPNMIFAVYFYSEMQ